MHMLHKTPAQLLGVLGANVREPRGARVLWSIGQPRLVAHAIGVEHGLALATRLVPVLGVRLPLALCAGVGLVGVLPRVPLDVGCEEPSVNLLPGERITSNVEVCEKRVLAVNVVLLCTIPETLAFSHIVDWFAARDTEKSSGTVLVP